MTEPGIEIRQSLHTMLTQAEIDFEMWMAMRTALQDPDLRILVNRRYLRFYLAAQNALFNSLITILYSVFETRKDTANFSNLRKTFPEDADPHVLAELNGAYDQVKKTWKKIAIVRNYIVGHQSLERTAKEAYDLAGMSISDLRDLIGSCQMLLVRIASVFHDTHIVFNLKGAETFDRLISDLKTSNSETLSLARAAQKS